MKNIHIELDFYGHVSSKKLLSMFWFGYSILACSLIYDEFFLANLLNKNEILNLTRYMFSTRGIYFVLKNENVKGDWKICLDTFSFIHPDPHVIAIVPVIVEYRSSECEFSEVEIIFFLLSINT